MAASSVVARRAEVADIPRLVELRALMVASMGDDFDAVPGMRDAAAAWFARRLAAPEAFAAFVVEVADAGVVACAIGTIEDHAPSPRSPSGLRGEIANVCTFEAFRGRGFARACVEALLSWFRDETEATLVRLAATEDGASLYRSLGFAPPRDLILQLKLAR